MEQWADMLDKVELHDPSQMEIAGVVSAQFSSQEKELAAAKNGLELEVNNVKDIDLDSSSAGNSGKKYPRTPLEQKDYDREELAYDAARKLLNFDGLKNIEKPRYLVKRWVRFLFYITWDHKVVFIPWDFSFMNPFYINGVVYACGHKIFSLVLKVIKIRPSFASLTHEQ